MGATPHAAGNARANANRGRFVHQDRGRKPAVARRDPILAALDAVEQAVREATQARMQAVRDAPSRIDCIERSRELWHADAALLPRVLARWAIHEDEIREAVDRPPLETKPLIVAENRRWLPIAWTRPAP